MSSKVALFLAVLLHAGLKILVFMDPPINAAGCCALRLNARSVMFLSSIVMYLSRTKVFPQRYRKVPLSAQAVVEFFFFLLAIEIAMIAGWCRIEALLFKIFECMSSGQQSMLYADMGGESLVEFVVTLLSFIAFVITATATGYVDSFSGVYQKAVDKLGEVVEKVRGRRRDEDPDRLCCLPCPAEAEHDEVTAEVCDIRTPRRSTRRTRSRESTGYASYLEIHRRSPSARRQSCRRR
uniref:Putative secreted protein n=1 Tax=Aedes albopictus TaxID=7160 RepID=A0A023EKP2_AEDAL